MASITEVCEKTDTDVRRAIESAKSSEGIHERADRVSDRAEEHRRRVERRRADDDDLTR
jgi:hypothetical protein